MSIMKKRTILPLIALCSAFALMLTFSLTSSYLMDKETADNIITIGDVQVSIEESDFDPNSSHPAAAGTVIPKSPKVTNTGTNDEYVFLEIDVPKKNVTLLCESDGVPTGKTRGQKINNEPSDDEIFKILVSTDTDNSRITGYSEPNKVFSYHSGSSDSTGRDGWYYIFSETSEITIDSKKYTKYIFGYNKKLAKGQSTKTLFDKVQLKSFIDAELTGTDANVDIKVKAYGIQADEIGINPETNGYLTSENAGKILTILKNKQVM